MKKNTELSTYEREIQDPTFKAAFARESGKTSDIKLTSFLKIVRAYGFSLDLVKGKIRIPVIPQTGKQEFA